ncbi:hypothetical protein AB0399_38540 [Streptomyces sp. NPDC088194]
MRDWTDQARDAHHLLGPDRSDDKHVALPEHPEGHRLAGRR